MTRPAYQSVDWRRSSYSNQAGGNCVEVGVAATLVPVRDSKAPGIGHLIIGAASWTALTASLRA
ncbi:DUF397 domain-containing protein [Embleya sp. NPDC050154]|uniref:DUF397 domain-containing protein n=1 Tax=Embleya sp. NPDC050154 TaxID=3363988 RepID=UPI0037B94722